MEYQSWRELPAVQQPDYPDKEDLARAEKYLANQPPLVFAGEVSTLTERLAKVCKGKAFILQGGDCAESFSQVTADNIRDTLRVILQMAVVLAYARSMPVVKIARIAGQYAKPRSDSFEERNGVKLPSYRGDIVNDISFTEEGRIPDPNRLIKAYNKSAITLNLLRAFSNGGFADLHQVNDWNLDFTSTGKANKKYQKIARRIDECMLFMDSIGIGRDNPIIRETEIYTSHEGLLLNYEQSLTRRDSLTGKWYALSAHMLWIGERTRQLDHAHVHYMRGINNPVGVKISNKIQEDELVKLCHALNPQNTPGKLTLITRMGASEIANHLPKLLRLVKREGLKVVWSCDPMHANTEKTRNGYKTRSFEKVISEIKQSIQIHHSEGTHLGGVHLEMTGLDVTECLGGLQDISEINLADRYHTHCDPRLNASQALELAFVLADML